MRDWSYDDSMELVDPGLRGLYESAAADTYLMVWYTFNTNNWMGWTRVDNTAQVGTWFHVDDFAGLSSGFPVLEGTKSMWCGVRANAADPYLCAWEVPPGYGNNWSQVLITDPFAFTGTVTLEYMIRWDSEPGYDYTYVEYDAGGGRWVELAKYDDAGTETNVLNVVSQQIQTKLRFRFASDGAWSDEDGLWDTDGAVVLDAIRIQDAMSFSNYENFESYAVGATECGLWHAVPGEAYGRYSGLWNNLSDKDPCGDNFSTQIVFFVDSGVLSDSYPGLYDTPFCKGPGNKELPCQDEAVISPTIDMTRYSTAGNEVQDALIPNQDLNLLGGASLRFTVYRDLPLKNLVFYTWGVRSIISGCPGTWKDDNFVYYGPDMDYIYTGADVSKYIGGNDPVQIRVGVSDMCAYWYIVYGDCAAHTPSPWLDNVRLVRYKTVGPQWGSRDLDFFQDNFPRNEYDVESLVRCDAANDILPGTNPNIRPGDSLVVDCTSILTGGLRADAGGGASIYINVKATYIGPTPAKPNLYGPTLAGSVLVSSDPETYVNFRYISDNGVWTKIQCDTARTNAGIVEGKWMIDLNDELFTRGYKIEYYFTAVDKANKESAYPRYARSGPPYFEWTCLPTLNTNVLFVDDFTGRGSFIGSVEQYWMPVFKAVLSNPNVDVYDVNGPSSGVSNGPGSRAKNKFVRDAYEIIIWDSGDLESVTISEGTSHSDKSNDVQMLLDWMTLSEHQCGLWICGDDIAYDLDGSPALGALNLMAVWCGVDFVATSYFDETGGRTGGGVVSPLVTGHTDANIFVHSGVPDKFYAYGGCFVINQFDCLDKQGTGKYALSYPDYKAVPFYAGIANERVNDYEFTVRTMWFGFSFQYVRDDTNTLPMDKFEIGEDVLAWFQALTLPNITDVEETPAAYKLAQNFPNPFNPSTKITFDMREKGFVTLKIYNVAGQLVRTLVEGVMDAKIGHEVTWDGRNDRGGAVASGIYFYKMETKDFSQTKKMVMLR